MSLVAFNLQAQQPIKIAVVGTSIDRGDGVANFPTDAWPFQFQQMLGSDYSISDYGVSGGTYSYGPSAPNSIRATFRKSSYLNKNIVILGGPTNDCQLTNAHFVDTSFKRCYQSYIDSIRLWAAPGVVIYCNTAIKALHPNVPQSKVDTVNSWVRKIARDNGLTVWSFDQIPAHPLLKFDGIHPDGTAGHTIMAQFAYKEFTNGNSEKYKPIEELPESPSENRVPLWPGVDLHINGKNRTLRKF